MMKQLAFSLGLVSVLVTGCAAPQPTPHTFSLLYNEKESVPLQEDWLILEAYKERRSVSFDVRTANDADYEGAIIEILESGNVPDIVLKAYPRSVEGYAAEGILLPFSDYEDLMPHFRTYIADRGLQSEVDKLRLENGKYYILPGFQRRIQVQQWIYRRDLFEAHGLGTPGTYDELFDALVILKKAYPDTAPLTACWGGAHLFAMMGAGYGIPAGWSGTRHYNVEMDRWHYAPVTDNYRAFLGFLSRSYDAGILDPDTFSQSVDDYTAKLVDGRGLVTVSWITSGFSSWNDELNENGHPEGEWAPLPVPESTWGLRALPPVDPFKKGLIVPSPVMNEPYLEDLLRFLDWAVYSEEGRELTAWGIEGVTFEERDDGKAFLSHVKTPKNPEGTVDATAEYGLNTLFDLTENEAYEDYKKPPEITAFLKASLEAGETADMPPRLELGSDAIDATGIIQEGLDAYVAESTRGFITGDLSIEEDWDDYAAELERRGYETLEEIWNSTWSDQSS